MKDKQEIIEKKVASSLRRGNTFIDIGGFIGINALIAADKVGPNGSVFVFEPASDNFKSLDRNTANVDNVVAIQAGISNEKSEEKLFLSKDDPEDNRFIDFEGAYDYETVEVLRLDSYNFDFKINLIKVSAQGREDYAIEGAIEHINKDKPKIMVDFNEKLIVESGGDPATILTYYESLGYDYKFIYNHNKNGLLFLTPNK